MLLQTQRQLERLIHEGLMHVAKNKQLDYQTLPVPRLERPKVAEHGDVATNIAMQIAKSWKVNPKELAGELVK